MENQRIVLGDDEVILLENAESALRRNFGLPRTFRIDDLKAKFHRNPKLSVFDWVEVEVMRLGKGEWQKGKIRIECVFVAEEDPKATNIGDTSLDELRNTINEFSE
jgi:hypothetical protein